MAPRSMSPEYLPVPDQSLEAGRAELYSDPRGYLLGVSPGVAARRVADRAARPVIGGPG